MFTVGSRTYVIFNMSPVLCSVWLHVPLDFLICSFSSTQAPKHSQFYKFLHSKNILIIGIDHSTPGMISNTTAITVNA